MATKAERPAVSPTAEPNALLRRAADLAGTDQTKFTATAMLAHAGDMLAGSRMSTRDVQRLALISDARALLDPQR